MIIYSNLFNKIISPENLFSAWDQFKRGKGNKPDVLLFEKNLEQNIFGLYRDLKSQIYEHGPYQGFWIRDPKLRRIHKATVRDRVLHHAVFRILNNVFDPTFIQSSFSCRLGRGTHKGVLFLSQAIRRVSQNYIHPCFVLKCDVRKFFDSVDHSILLGVLKRKITDPKVGWLLKEIIMSYSISSYERERERESKQVGTGVGIPIGNLTSQIFANIYLNEFDRFIKHELKVKHYARYTDDFVIISDQENYLKGLLVPIKRFLLEKLRLNLHPNKVSIIPINRGIDFLGYVAFPYHILPRAKTKKRIWRKFKKLCCNYRSGLVSEETLLASLNSYLGFFSHANAHSLSADLKNQIWF